MALFVGLDVSPKTTSICVVEADGAMVWEGKAESERQFAATIVTRRADCRTQSRDRGSACRKPQRCQFEARSNRWRGLSWLYRHTEVLARKLRNKGKLMLRVRVNPDKVAIVRTKFGA